MPPLATTDDYELLMGPVAPADEPRLAYLLGVSTAVVVVVAPGLMPWVQWPTDPITGLPVDPGPIPPPATLVTCQVAARLMDDPAGANGAITMERIGLVETQYQPDWSVANALLPTGWKLLLKPWRPPDLASVRLATPHPAEYLMGGYGGDWWWPGLLDHVPL
jgi:hypothetical protein